MSSAAAVADDSGCDAALASSNVDGRFVAFWADYSAVLVAGRPAAPPQPSLEEEAVEPRTCRSRRYRYESARRRYLEHRRQCHSLAERIAELAGARLRLLASCAELAGDGACLAEYARLAGERAANGEGEGDVNDGYGDDELIGADADCCDLAWDAFNSDEGVAYRSSKGVYQSDEGVYQSGENVYRSGESVYQFGQAVYYQREQEFEEFDYHTEAEGDGEGNDQELVLDEGYAEFLRQSEAHRRKRDTGGSTDAPTAVVSSGDGGAKAKASSASAVDASEAANPALRATVAAPTIRPGLERTQEMKQLYGRHAVVIQGMETSMQLKFDQACDAHRPAYWPSIPLRPVFN